MPEDQLLSKPILHVILILAAIVCLMEVAMTIVIGALGYSGFAGTTPISAICTTAYWLTKFFDIKKILETSFVHLIISAISSIVLVVLLISVVLKIKKEEVVFIRGPIKILLYIFASITVYTVIIPAGYYLTLQTQIDNCTNPVYDTTRLLAFAICCMILVGLSSIVWVFLLCIYHKTTDPSEKYREVTNSQTQPNQTKHNEQQRIAQEGHHYVQQERRNYGQEQRNKDQKDHKDNGRRAYEQTDQNLYDSPSKNAIVHSYMKEPDSRNEEVQHVPASRTQQNDYNNPQYQSRVRSNMPMLEPKDSRTHDSRYKSPNESRFKNNQPNRGYQKHQPRQDQGLVYKKEANSPQRSPYMQSLLRESKGYLNKRGKNSVIDGQGQIQQRQSRGSDYGRPIQDHGRRPNNRPSNRSPEREGVLLNYIRGKYAG